MTMHMMTEKDNCDHQSWQERMQSVSQRDNYLLHHQMWTDCSFLVGHDKQEKTFECHRLTLAKSSPAFAAMLYGDLFRKDEVIRIPDVTQEAFAALLNYVYDGRVYLDNFEVACGLLCAGKKYLMPASLLLQCRVFLWHNLLPDNVWQAMEFASVNNEPELYDTAMQIAQRRTSDVLKLPSFNGISETNLLALLELDDFAVTSELELYEACLRWASSKSLLSLSKTLEPILGHIRFLTFSPQEFLKGPAKSGLLTQSECYSILSNLNVPGCMEVPDNICSIQDKRIAPHHGTYYVYGSGGSKNCECDEVDKDGEIREILSASNIFATASVKKNSSIASALKIQIPTQYKESTDDSVKESYHESLSVYIINVASKSVIAVKHVAGSVNYNATMTTSFILEAPENTTIDIRIAFHVSGWYPHGSLIVNKKNLQQ